MGRDKMIKSFNDIIANFLFGEPYECETVIVLRALNPNRF